MKHQELMRLATSLFTCLFLIAGLALPVAAEILPGKIRTIIEKKYPGAEIDKMAEGSWQGIAITEVEITAKDGSVYEIYISEEGKILKVEEDKMAWLGGDLSIGFAAVAESEIYKGGEAEFEPAPFFRYEYGPLALETNDGIEAIFSLYRASYLSVAVKGTVLMGEGYDAGDSDYLTGMDELHTLFNAAVEVESEIGGCEVGIEFAQDASGEHGGQKAELSLSYEWIAAGFEFRPTLSVTWLSKKTVDYFYGVSTREATADRLFYSPGSSYEASAELMVQKPIFGNYTAVGIAEVSTFGSEVTDSPLVDKDYEVSGVLGVMYTF